MEHTNGATPGIPYQLFQLAVETKFDTAIIHEWFTSNTWIPFFCSLVYLYAVSFLQNQMRNRKPVDLKGILVLWNLALAVFSALATAKLVPETYHVLSHFGFRYSICDNNAIRVSRSFSFWASCFVLSKIVELFDTVFLVLKKRPVTFLHVFHHCSVMVFAWTMQVDRSSVGRWYQAMNFTVHSAMYSYYALAALKIKVPRKLAMSLTVVQIVQMIVGLFVTLAASAILLSGEKCDTSKRTAIFGLLLYFVYGALFVNYFVRSYLYPKSKVP